MNHDGQIGFTTQVMDLFGVGHLYSTAWAANTDGVLVLDKFHDGQLHDATQFAFTTYGGHTDLEGLASFDSNGDGKLDAGDAQYADFKVWMDKNGDGKVESGEMVSLAQADIQSINLSSDGITRNEADGVTSAGHSTATTTNGTQILVDDASFSYQSAEAAIGNAQNSAHVVEMASGSANGSLLVDAFAFHLADAPVSSSITGFGAAAVVAGGDILDLRDLLQGEQHLGVNPGNLGDYLNISVSNGSTVIEVKEHGVQSTDVSQKIVLADVDLSAGVSVDAGQSMSQAIIQDLLSKGKLITD